MNRNAKKLGGMAPDPPGYAYDRNLLTTRQIKFTSKLVMLSNRLSVTGRQASTHLYDFTILPNLPCTAAMEEIMSHLVVTGNTTSCSTLSCIAMRLLCHVHE